jgi:hypothetical protein
MSGASDRSQVTTAGDYIPGVTRIEPGMTILPTPNGQLDADWETVPFSHELLEALTDPLNKTPAWAQNKLSQDSPYTEIGDPCSNMVGDFLDPSTGGNVVLHNHAYLVQEIWSNAAGACVLQ